MQEEQLQLLNELLYEYFTELEKIQNEHNNNTDAIYNIEDELDKLLYNGYINDPIVEALQHESKRLNTEGAEIEQQYYQLLEYGDIQSLIEDINDLW